MRRGRWKTKKEERIKAPRKRFGSPCYDKGTCSVNFCKEADFLAEGYETTATIMLRRNPRKEIYRQPCDKDCKRRINLDAVSVKVCIKAKCEFFSPEGFYCKKYVEENKRRHNQSKTMSRTTLLENKTSIKTAEKQF